MHLVHALKQRPSIMIPPRILQTPHVPLRLPSQRQERLDLRSNQQPPPTLPTSIVPNRPEQRLDPIPISRRNKDLALLIPEYDCEFAAQVLGEVQPVVEVQRDDNLGIRPRGELVVGGLLELGADAVVVVELAVDNCVDAVGWGVEGLGGGWREIVNREADVA